jgi:CheY-like chemotaxis protein
MVMPGGMTGADLAREVRSTRPDIKVLFTSGYAEQEIVKRGRLEGSEWLRKPYTATDAARMLRKVLEAPTAAV